jgi:hypothetical protein
MTTFQPAFKTAKCAKCGTYVGFNKELPKGVVYCTKHRPVTTVSAPVVVTPEQVATQEAFNAVMEDSNTVLTLDNNIKTKVEKTMTTVKEKAVVGMEAVEAQVAKGKELVTKHTATVSEFVKGKYEAVKESRLVKWVKKAYHSTIGFLGGKKTAIAVGSASVMAGGIVTGSAVAAVAVGTAVAVAVVGASHAMQKKKEQKLSYKAMLTDMGVATGTVVALPFALFGLAYVGLFATVFGAILPYSIIVA